MSCYCDYDPAIIWNERCYKARKQYKCCECKNVIEVGEDYIDIAALSEGKWEHMKMCEYCRHDWKVVTDAGHCYLVGNLAECWEDIWKR
jgi:hypothetical protein